MNRLLRRGADARADEPDAEPLSAGNWPLRLEGVSHRYGKTQVLQDIWLGIAEGEFVTLLGSSGCGKTTLLRAIAGFLKPTSGRVYLEGRDVTGTPAHKRSVNMVFQRSSLFPHLTVADNIAFGPRLAGVARADRDRVVEDALALTRLEGFGSRRSHELSGGQVQRVALARAIVNRPKVLLFDEPLSALDLKIKLEMEAELRRVHRETGATSVYVTHDQREALALSDRVVVLDAGRIEQVGTPEEIYESPASPFVARSVGSANVLPVDVLETASRGKATVSLAGSSVAARCDDSGISGQAWLVLRPEAIELDSSSQPCLFTGVVRDAAFRGTGHSYSIAVQGLQEPLKVERPGTAGPPVNVGDSVTISWKAEVGRLISRQGAEATSPIGQPDTMPHVAGS